MHKYKAIIFDSEGVIINSEVLWDKAQEILLRRRNIKYDRSLIKHLIAGRSQEEGVQIILNQYGLKESIEDIIIERLSLIEELIKSDLEFIQGFQSFITEVSHLDYKIAVATSMSKKLLELVKIKLPLEQYFGEHIYSIDDINGKGKPAPDLFLYTAKKLEINPDDCIVIEDSPLGIRAAKSARMFSIALTTTFQKDKLAKETPDLIVNSYNEMDILLTVPA